MRAQERWKVALWGLIGLGTLVRVMLTVLTDGSAFDTESFRLAAEQLRHAPLQFYAVLGGDAFRWPYPPGFLPWIAAARELSDATGISFLTMISLPAIVADGAIAWLVQDFLGRRGTSPGRRLAAAALVALGPPFFVASGYLPQIDSVAFLPAVLAVWLWDRDIGDSTAPAARGRAAPDRALLAGLLIGLGCAIKTMPILIILALLPTARDRRERVTLIAAAAAVPLLSLIPFLITTPGVVLGTFDYAGVPGAGGLSLVVQPEMAERWLTQFHDLNRVNEILLANRSAWTLLTVALVGAFVYRRRTAPALAATLLWLSFYVTGTGFFFQYLIWGLPFMLMAGLVASVALVELAVAVPMLLFYLGPWESGAIPVVYWVLMVGLWVAFCAWLYSLARREHGDAGEQRRARPPLIATATARLAAAIARLLPGERPPAATGEPPRSASRSQVIVVLVALAAFSAVSLVLVAVHASPGDVFTGADGPFAADQLQYMAWIRDASGHLLADNGYSLEPSGHVYLHPMIAVSGLVDRLTGALQASYLLWKPVAVVLMFGGFWLYVRRLVSGRGAQVAALVLALFFASPAGPLADWLGLSGEHALQLGSLTAEAFNATLLWGYLPAAVALGLVPLFVLALEGVLEPTRRRAGWTRRRCLALAGAAGLLAAWIHPWQGEILLAIVAGLAIWKPAQVRRRDLLIPAAATAAPLLYYLLLSETAPAWELAKLANQGDPQVSAAALIGLAPLAATTVLIGLAALLVPASLAFGSPAQGAQERILRIWPLAALAVQFFAPAVPGHAFQGIALPLAILAVRGWQRLELPRGSISSALAVVAVALLTVPGAIWMVDWLDGLVASRAQAHLLSPGEDRALEYLNETAAGADVLATPYLGAAVPAFSSSHVWAGHPSWTPDWPARATAAEELFSGDLDRDDARRLVAGSGASLLLSDCRGRIDLSPILGPLIAAERRFGCATVYRLRQD